MNKSEKEIQGHVNNFDIVLKILIVLRLCILFLQSFNVFLMLFAIFNVAGNSDSCGTCSKYGNNYIYRSQYLFKVWRHKKQLSSSEYECDERGKYDEKSKCIRRFRVKTDLYFLSIFYKRHCSSCRHDLS